MAGDNILLQYIRNQKRQPRGIAIAKMGADGIVRYGFSLRNKKDKDRNELGVSIAAGRISLERGGPNITVDKTAQMVKDTLTHLDFRAKKYFKDATGFTPIPEFECLITNPLAAAVD